MGLRAIIYAISRAMSHVYSWTLLEWAILVTVFGLMVVGAFYAIFGK